MAVSLNEGVLGNGSKKELHVLMECKRANERSKTCDEDKDENVMCWKGVNSARKFRRYKLSGGARRNVGVVFLSVCGCRGC